MRTKQQITSSLADKVREQAHLVSVLGLWADAQGIDPETVQSFTLWPAFFSKTEEIAYREGRFTDGPPRNESTVLMFNALRLKDGSLRKLDPMLKRR